MTAEQKRQGFTPEFKKEAVSSIESSTSSELKRLKKIEKEHDRLLMKYEVLKKSIQYCSDQKKRSSNS
jgi:hypothetical protein